MSPWPQIPLGEVASPVSRPISVEPGREYRTIGVKWWGEGAYERETIDGARTAAKTLSFVRTGDLIINKIWVRNGSTAVATKVVDGCAASNEFPTFHLDSEKVLGRWLHWQTKTRVFWSKCDALSKGTSGKNRIKPEQFLSIKIPLPPLPEQRRIVARIEELAAQIQEARTLREHAKTNTSAVYLSALGSVIDPNREGWKKTKLSTVVASMDAGWSPQCEDIPACPGEWGVLKTTSVQWCDFQPEHNKRLPASLSPIPSLSVKKGDVLVTRAGPRKRVGVVAAAHRDEPFLTISDKTIRLRPKLEEIESDFLALSLSSPFSQEYLIQRKTGLADAQVNISQAILRETPIAYPPLAEQRRIVAELSALQTQVDALQKLQNETAAELDALLPSILDKAFKGEL